ncbi:MAG: GNAT family N-acetyltransferase [Gemmatimonadota bacterium]
MTRQGGAILELGAQDVGEVADVLCESFFDYPVMRFVLGRNSEDYEERLKILIHFFTMARVLKGESMFGIGEADDLSAVALVARVPGQESPAELDELREGIWAELGSAARTRYEAFGAACASFVSEIPHLHLDMIGVRDRDRGRGLGRTLITRVHSMSREDPDSEGVTLTTENPANVALYEHFGYRIVGHATVAPGLKTWSFFRPD